MIVESLYGQSKTLYAIDWTTFQAEDRGSAVYASADAIWTVKKKGRVQVCAGQLFDSFYKNGEAFSVDREYFMENFDSRYGGTAKVRWDGAYMWAPELTLSAMNSWADRLDPFLKNLPSVPAGHEGWYALDARRG